MKALIEIDVSPQVSPSGIYFECLHSECDCWGAIEDAFHPENDPDFIICPACHRPVTAVWNATAK